MTRQEFLAKLRQALESELDHRTVQENVDYYNSYIIEETAKGRPESDVIAELGDPWVIARSVIGMSGDGLGARQPMRRLREEAGKTRAGKRAAATRQREGGGFSTFGTWWKRLLLVLGIIGVFLLVIAVIGGIFSLLMPILVPVLVIVLIIRLIGGARR
mgnify:CR=1 FL=1